MTGAEQTPYDYREAQRQRGRELHAYAAEQTPQRCYCGGPEEMLYGHEYGKGRHCRQKTAAPPCSSCGRELITYCEVCDNDE